MHEQTLHISLLVYPQKYKVLSYILYTRKMSHSYRQNSPPTTEHLDTRPTSFSWLEECLHFFKIKIALLNDSDMNEAS